MNNLGGACFVVNWVLANPLAQNCVYMQSNLDSSVIYKREGQSLVQSTCVVLHALKQSDSTSLPISLPKWVVHDSLKLDSDKAKLRSLYKNYLDIMFYYAQIGSRSHFQESKLHRELQWSWLATVMVLLSLGGLSTRHCSTYTIKCHFLVVFKRQSQS